MVKMFTVNDAEEIKLEMRGNFVKLVDKQAGLVEVRYVNVMGVLVHLNYDVQSAMLELFSELSAQRNIAVTYKDEAASLRGELKLRDGVVLQLKEDRKVSTGNITLGGFVAWAERVKGLFVDGKEK